MSTAPRTNRVPRPILSSSYLAAGMAVVLTLEIFGLAWYTYLRIQTALEPENLAERVETAIRENYPEFREELVIHVQEEAPAIAQQVSEEMIAAAPDARQELEQLTARQIEIGLDSATDLSADAFREMLQENHDEILEIFEAIEEAPDEAHQLAVETENNIEQQFGVDIERQAKAALRTHRKLNQKLERLSQADETLSAKELIERRIVRILRTMQEKHLETAQATTPTTVGAQ